MKDFVDRVLDQWKAERPDLDASPMGVLGRLSRASALTSRELRKTFSAYDLQPWEFDVLATLLRSGPPYRMSAGALVDSSMVTSGAITNRIDRLVARDLVDREIDPTNRRSVLIGLTGLGKRLIDQAVAARVDREHDVLTLLSTRDQEQLARILRKLLLGLGDSADTPSSTP